MKIELITKGEFNKLMEIYHEHPLLTFENKGYSYINKSKLSDLDINAIKEIESILKKNICGFSEFNNFRNRDNRVQLRLQYNYGAENNSIYFIGVGYIYLDELLNGFDD